MWLMRGRVRSVNVATEPRRVSARAGRSGIDKRPTDLVTIRDPGPRAGGEGSGVVGDTIVDRRHHGGELQAVYAVAREELDAWAAELGRVLPDGMFGENLTTEGIDIDAAVIGEQWEFEGGVVLRACAPRIPCATFAGHMGERGWVKRFATRGRTGVYLAVERQGVLRAGETFTVSGRDEDGPSVMELFRATMGDRDLAVRLLDSGRLPESLATKLAASLPTRDIDH